MADTNPPSGGDHIEELLSQLKGIFGHLSETEQEEAKQKITPPPAEVRPAAFEDLPVIPPADSTPPKTPQPSKSAAKDIPELTLKQPAPEPAPPGPDLVDFMPGSPAPESSAPELPADIPAAPTGPDSYTPHEATVPPGASLIPAAVFFPEGRTHEAKSVVDKVEKITPKFTKVAVVLNVQALAPYNVKSDIKEFILFQTQSRPIKAVFFIIEKPMEDAKRKALIAELEPKGIYFQEIPLQQIEKKALYTDMLLGMVFFFDSQKPARGETAA